MFKNQLQELAQRSCFNLPSYACIREGPDHAPRFKARVNFNGEMFESPGYCPTLRQAEHAAAEVALNILSSRGSKSLTARVLDETGVYKNLLQETAHKAGLNLPVYTTVRSGPGHVPTFTCTVELAGMSFTGESAKTKKQAEKNAAIAAWSSLKKMPKLVSEKQHDQEQDQAIVARVLSNLRTKTGGTQRDQHPRRSRNARAWRLDHSTKYKPLEFPQISTLKGSSDPIKHNSSFIDLLPPPPPRMISKILPLATTCTKNREGHDGKFVQDPNKVTNTAALKEQGHTHFRGLFLGPANPSTALERAPNLSCAQIGIFRNYIINPKGVAPAVQIRSIVPVCAAPTLPPPLSSLKPFPLNPTLPLKEASSSYISSASPSTDLSCAHLSSELSKLNVKGD